MNQQKRSPTRTHTRSSPLKRWPRGVGKTVDKLVRDYQGGARDSHGRKFKLYLTGGGNWEERVARFKKEVEDFADEFHLRSYVHKNGVLTVLLTAYRHGKAVW